MNAKCMTMTHDSLELFIVLIRTQSSCVSKDLANTTSNMYGSTN